MKGYWLNSKTDRYWEIVDHALALTTRNEIVKFGLSKRKMKKIAAVEREALNPAARREKLLRAAMAAGLIRVRQHRIFITFEHTVQWEEAWSSIYMFMKSSKLYQHVNRMRITNIDAHDTAEMTWEEFKDLVAVETTPYISVRWIPGFPMCENLPVRIETDEDYEAYACDRAKEVNRKVCLVLPDGVSVWINEDGQIDHRSGPKEPAGPYIQVGGRRFQVHCGMTEPG